MHAKIMSAFRADLVTVFEIRIVDELAAAGTFRPLSRVLRLRPSANAKPLRYGHYFPPVSF